MKSSETSRERGYDAGRVNGRRRHILVDTMGPLLMVLDFSASVQDQDGARRLGMSEFYATRDDQESIAGIHRATGFGVKHRAFRARISASNSLQTS